MYSSNGIPFQKKKNFRMDGQTDKRTNGRTNERTDGPIILCPNFIWGHKKVSIIRFSCMYRLSKGIRVIYQHARVYSRYASSGQLNHNQQLSYCHSRRSVWRHLSTFIQVFTLTPLNKIIDHSTTTRWTILNFEYGAFLPFLQ